MKKRSLWWAWALAALAIAGMIFAFSAQGGPESMRTSNGVAAWLLRLAVPDHQTLPQEERLALERQYQFWVRKSAHFTEFFLLGLALRLLTYHLRWRRGFGWAFVMGTVYAVTDEWHQLLVDSRSAMWQDVCIDSAGVLFGALLAAGIVALYRRRSGPPPPPA